MKSAPSYFEFYAGSSEVETVEFPVLTVTESDQSPEARARFNELFNRAMAKPVETHLFWTPPL